MALHYAYRDSYVEIEGQKLQVRTIVPLRSHKTIPRMLEEDGELTYMEIGDPRDLTYELPGSLDEHTHGPGSDYIEEKPAKDITDQFGPQ